MRSLQKFQSLSLEISFSDFSVLGDKTCTFSNNPDACFTFSDTGGIFGEKKEYQLGVDEFLKRRTLIGFVCHAKDRDMVAHIVVNFSDGQVSAKTDSASEFMTMLQEVCVGKKFPVIYLPVELERSEVEQLKPRISVDLAYASWVPFITGYNEPSPGLHTLPMAFTNEDRRLKARLPFGPIADLPSYEGRFGLSGAEIELRGRLFISETAVSGLRILLPSAECTSTALDVLGLVQNETTSSSDLSETLHGRATLSGYIRNERVTFDAEVELSRTSFSVKIPTGDVKSLEFVFSDIELALGGTSNTFLISDRTDTVLCVKPSSAAFHGALRANRELSAAVERSSNIGPFVCFLGENVARVEGSIGGLFVHSASGSFKLNPANIKIGVPDEDLNIEIYFGDQQVIGSLAMMEGIAGLARSSDIYLNRFTYLSDSISQIVGMDSHYFLDTVFGQLVRIHLSISQSLVMDPTSELKVIGESNQIRFLELLSHALPQLIRSFDTIFHYLPSFVYAMDSAFLSSAGISSKLNRERLEPAYTSALSGTHLLVARLSRIEACLARLRPYLSQTAEEDGMEKFLPLGISAIAAYVNPLMLVGTAQQGLAMYRSQHSKDGAIAKLYAESLSSCEAEWNSLMQLILPSVVHKFLAEIYPLRLNNAALLLSEDANAKHGGDVLIRQAVAKRLGKLDIFREFPFDCSGASRAQIVTFLQNQLTNSNPLGFRHF